MARLSLESRNRVITLFSRGYTVLEIQQRLHEERTTVSCQALYNLLLKFREKNTIENLPGRRRPVTPKSGPPEIGPAGLILAEKPAKTGPPDHFWCQNWSPLAKISPPCGKKLSAKIGPPQSITLIPVRMWLHGCNYYI